jgi:hypothetical protein
MSASLSSNHHHNHNHGGRDNLNGMFDYYLSKPQPGAIIVYIRHVRLRSRPINGAVEAFSPKHFNVRGILQFINAVILRTPNADLKAGADDKVS